MALEENLIAMRDRLEQQISALRLDLQIATESRDDWESNYNTLADNNTALREENERLKTEIESAMKVLKPNMPESGLRDACCQVKQVAISAEGNYEYYKKEITRLLGLLKEIEDHEHIATGCRYFGDFKELELMPTENVGTVRGHRCCAEIAKRAKGEA